MRFRLSTLAVFSLVAAVALASCGSGPEDSETPNTFQSLASQPDGRAVALAGESTGHEAGVVSTFVVTLENGADEPWRDGYCLLLVEDGGIVSNLAQTTFDLSPEEGERDTITVTFPDDVGAGHYGLTLLIPGRSSVTSAITVGDVPDSGVGDVSAPIGGRCATGRLPDAAFGIEREPFLGTLTPREAGTGS